MVFGEGFLFDDDSSMISIYEEESDFQNDFDLKAMSSFNNISFDSVAINSYNNNLEFSSQVKMEKKDSSLSSALSNSFTSAFSAPISSLSSTLPQKNLNYMSNRISKERSPSFSIEDEFESEIEERSLKRRRKVSADEVREKNRIYAKNHRAEKKRRQEELLKRNEMLEKENRHLRRLLMQLGIHPNNGSVSFNPAQTIKNVGNSLVKGVKGGIGFMIPTNTNGTKTQIDPSQAAFVPQIPIGNIQSIIPPNPVHSHVQGFSQNSIQNGSVSAQARIQVSLPNSMQFTAQNQGIKQDFQCDSFFVSTQNENDSQQDKN